MADFEDEKKVVNEDDDDDDDDNDITVTKKVEEEEKEEDSTLANTAVTTKYQEAAKILQSSLLEIIALCIPGANIVELCRAGDSFIEQKAAMIYRNKTKGKAIEKGIAFPVCISVNECVCHNSPLASEDSDTLKEGDMLKIDMGCHVDGFIAVVAHTLVVSAVATPAVPTTGPRADAMLAAYLAADIAAKLIRPGNKNKQVSDAIKKVAEAYKVNLVAGTVMHQMKRFVIDGNKVIVLREEDNQKVEECSFEQFEVYAIDVAMTTGEGKPREQNARTTVFKRNVDKTYHLKMKASRTLYSEVAKRFPTLPFTLRALGDERGARMGVRECVNHELLAPYPVLFERPGDQIAHVKFTVLLLPSGTVKITGLTLTDGEFVNNEVVLPEELQALLATQSLAAKKKKKKKAKKVGAEASGTAAAEEGGDNDEGDA